jgi:hypothetical protein
VKNKRMTLLYTYAISRLIDELNAADARNEAERGCDK